MTGPAFAGKQRDFILDVSLHSKVLNKPSANMFVVFLDSTHIAETTSDSNIQDSLHLASTVTMFINSVHISLSQKETKKKDHLQIYKKEKKHVYRDVYCLSDCPLIMIVQKHKATALLKHQHLIDAFWCSLVSMLNYRILIVHEENDIVLWN